MFRALLSLTFRAGIRVVVKALVAHAGVLVHLVPRVRRDHRLRVVNRVLVLLFVDAHLLGPVAHQIEYDAGQDRASDWPNDKACCVLIRPLAEVVIPIDRQRELLPDDYSESRGGIR